MKYGIYWFNGQNDNALNRFTFYSDILLFSRLFFDLKLLYCITLFPLPPIFAWILDRAVYLTLAYDFWYLFALNPFKLN